MTSDDRALADLEQRVSALTDAITEIAQQCQRIDMGLRTLAEHVDAIGAHEDGLVEHVEQAIARSWDHVAVARRLAALEDTVTELRRDAAAGGR